MRVVIELKRGELPEVVLNNLYKQTQLQDTFGINMVALVDGQPRLLNLKQMLDAFLAHRREVVTRRTVFDLRKARERAHIQEGLAVALSNVDEIIALIKQSQTPPEAKAGLMAKAWRSDCVAEMLSRAAADASRPEGLPAQFGLTEDGYRLSDAQAQAILEMRLQRLTGLEQDKIVAEYKELIERSPISSTSSPSPRASGDHRRGTEGDQGAVRRQAPKRDRPPDRGPVDGGPDHARGRGGDVLAHRLHQVAAARRLPGAAPRRARQAGDGDQGRRFHRAPVHRQHARHDAVLFLARASCTGSRSTRCRRARAPAAASRSSTCSRWPRARRSAPCCR